MSTCRCAPTSLGRAQQVAQPVRRRPRCRARAPRRGRAAVSAVTLTDRFTRGIGPASRARAWGGRASLPRPRERAQRLVAAPGVAVGLGGGDGRLAEQVDGGRRAGVPQASQRGYGVRGAGADDEALGHPVHRERRPRLRRAVRVDRRSDAAARRRPARAAAPPRRGERRGGRPGRAGPRTRARRRQGGRARRAARGRARAAPFPGPRARACGRGRPAPGRRRSGGRARARAARCPEPAEARRQAGGRGDDRHSRGDAMSSRVPSPSSAVRTSFDDCSISGEAHARDRVPWRRTARAGRAARPGPRRRANC